MDRQQLYRGHAERFDVFYDLIGKALVSAAPLFRQFGVELGKSTEMELIDDRVLPRDGATLGLTLPVEIRVDDNAFRHERRAVALIESRVVARFKLISKDRGVPFQIAEMPPGIGIEHQLVGIEPVAGGRLVGAVHAIAVNRSGTHIRHIAVPDLVGEFRQLEARRLPLAAVVEQAELDPRRGRREQREIDPLAVPGGAKRVRQSFPDAALGDCDHHLSLWLGKPALRNATGKQHRHPARSK